MGSNHSTQQQSKTLPLTAPPEQLAPSTMCITKMQNEAAMIKKYIANKKLRMSLAIEVDAMVRVPEVSLSVDVMIVNNCCI